MNAPERTMFLNILLILRLSPISIVKTKMLTYFACFSFTVCFSQNNHFGNKDNVVLLRIVLIWHENVSQSNIFTVTEAHQSRASTKTAAAAMCETKSDNFETTHILPFRYASTIFVALPTLDLVSNLHRELYTPCL